MTGQIETPSGGPSSRFRIDLRRPRFRLTAVAAVALVIGLLVWLFVRGGDSSVSSPVPKDATHVPISEDALKTLSAALGSPIYWVGPRTGYTYELDKTDDNRVYIRYLPAGVDVGSSKLLLTVGTYPVADAYALTLKLAKKSTAVKLRIGNGGVAFYNRASPTSVFFALPRIDYQVEVFDPSPARARQLVVSGRVRPAEY
jgi:hypothetical protein